MKILTRYILKEFSKPFFVSILFITVLILAIQGFMEIRLILDYKPGFWIILKYFTLKTPAFLIQIVPIATLFAVLFSLSRLAKNSELIAMRAGGVGIFLVATPLFLTGVLLFGLTLIFNDTIVPKVVKMERHTKWVEIQKQPEPSASLFQQNISKAGLGNHLYHIAAFDGVTNSMTDIMILSFGPDKQLQSRLDAKSAKFEGNQWVFYGGYFRTFDATGNEVSTQAFDRMPLTLPEVPADFLKEQKEPQELDLAELIAYIRQLKLNGFDYHKELVEFHHKIAIPFGCVILSVLGVPWGWRMGKYSGVVLSFLICMAVAFVYLGGMEIGHSLGDSGVLPPFLSMWILNILFAIGGAVLLIKKNR